MSTPIALYFLLLCLLPCLQQTYGTTDAPQVTLGEPEPPMDSAAPKEDLKWAEMQALQNTNHQLGNMEYDQGVTYSIPFDTDHFIFDSADWIVYDLPNSTNEQMIVSVPSASPSKELVISTAIREYSDLKISYQIHLTDDIPVKPSFSVFLITNGIKTLLKEEYPKELWSNSTLLIKTKDESRLLFVGVLKDTRNRMALRSFTVQDLSASAQKRYGNPSSTDNFLTGNERQPTASVSMSESSSHVESNFSEGENDSEADHSPRRSQVRIDFEDEDEAFGNYEGDGRLSDASAPENISAGPGKENSLGVLSGFQDEGQFNSSTSSTAPEMEYSSSVATEVVIFFAVLLAIVMIIFAFVFWRRRRKRAEDEIPVFSRSSTEHGNPAYVDDQTNMEITMNSEKQANYKSFE